jgi:hypothetical protein
MADVFISHLEWMGAATMHRAVLALSLIWALSLAGLAAQSPVRAAADAGVLATVHIPIAVTAGGIRLPTGTYDIRLTPEHPTALAGQSGDAQQWVEFVGDGKVIAREIAEVLRDDDLPAAGASSQPVRLGTRVEMLKGGEFLRISVKRERERYLIHLPVMP